MQNKKEKKTPNKTVRPPAPNVQIQEPGHV